MKKNKIHTPKTKEELIADLKNNTKFVAKMIFTKTKFYPALIDLDESVDEVKQFLASINTILMEKFLAKMKETKMSDMKLIEALDPKDPKYEKYKAILELFDDTTTFDAKDMIEGMKNEIQMFCSDREKITKLIDLPTKWLDEI